MILRQLVPIVGNKMCFAVKDGRKVVGEEILKSSGFSIETSG
jgi:hypothetical protein